MTIPDQQIAVYLDQLVGHSQPGAVLHHLLVSAIPEAGTDAFGLPDPAKLAVTLYAIAPDGASPVRTVEDVIRMAIFEAYSNDQVIHFAGLAMESYMVPMNPDGSDEDLARRLHAEGRLQDHPGAVEATKLYAACRDGRRWTGCRYLTGPEAGTTLGPKELAVGELHSNERNRQARLIRSAVGIRA